MAEDGGVTVERLRRGRYRLTSEIILPRPLEAVFRFFSDAHNLERLTPPWLAFRIVTPDPIEIRAGIRLEYRLRVRGVPLRWTSEIDHWEPPHRFTDWQVRGPYRRWEHEHRFDDHPLGTLAADRVEFEVPFGVVAGSLVSADVRRIFEFRQDRLRELFG